LTRTLAEHHAAMTDNDHAISWGIEYLQVADVLDVDLNDQAQRWGAFSRLKGLDGGTVLRHLDGSMLVRIGWFRAWVRIDQDHTIPAQQVQQRMMRVGWRIRGGIGGGRVKATCPGRTATLVWTFYDVPPDWGQDA